MASRKIFTQRCIQWIGARLDQDGVHVRIDRGGVTGGKPFFLGDMRSQCRPQCAHCACNGPVASGKKFYTEVYSFFFFRQQHPHIAPLGMYGPVARWRLEKNALPFFFFGSLGNVPPSVCKRKKKQKIYKKRCKKKVLLKEYYRDKIPLFFF